MKVIRARTAGFCMGVDLALRKLDRVVAENQGPIYTLGPIIHNPQVLEDYARRGVRRVGTVEEVPPGSKAVIRAHGIPMHKEALLRKRNVTIVDATCPKVKRAQILIQEQSAQGRFLLLYGEEDHPEVLGLRSYAHPNNLVFDSAESFDALALPEGTPCFLAAQTTQDRQEFEVLKQKMHARFGADAPVLNTICDATKERQLEALEIAQHVKAMVVVGGFESGNTRRLASVAADQGIFCVHVETGDQLPMDTLRGYIELGLTAGASTPKKVIDDIEEILFQG